MRKETEDTSIGASIDAVTENDTTAAADATAEPSANIDNVGDTEIVFARATNLKSKYPKFENVETNWSNLTGVLMNADGWPVAVTKNDAPVITSGPSAGAEVTNKSILGTTILIVDIDSGPSMEESAAALRGMGIEAVIASTFSYGVTQTDVKHDDVVNWANKNRRAEAIREIGTSTEATEEIGRLYLIDKGKIIPAIAAKAKYTGKGQTSAGIVYHFEHVPLAKHRIYIPLASHFNVSDFVSGDTTQGQVLEAYSNAYLEACSELEIPFDKACKDISRRYYLPSKRAADAKVPQPIHVRGRPYDLEAKIKKTLASLKAEPKQKQKTAHKASTSASVIFEGFNLKTWAAQYGKTFKVEDALASHGLVRGERPNGGSYVECHEKGHAGAVCETFAVNGDGEKGFTLYCSGQTGGCCDKDRLGHLLGYLENGELTLDDLKNPEFGGGEISNRAAHGKNRAERAKEALTKVVDGAGEGIDTAKFIDEGLSRLNIDKLRALRPNLPIHKTITAEALATLVREDHVRMQELLDCCEPEISSAADSPYIAKLRELVSERRKGLTNAGVKGRLKKLAAEMKQTDAGYTTATVEADYDEQYEKDEKDRARLGVLSFAEIAKIRSHIDYNARFAIVDQGGKAYVHDTYKADFSKSLSTHADFTKLYRKDWYEVETPFGTQIKYPAQDWLNCPDDNTRVYNGGVIFSPPSSTRARVPDDCLNLYSGMLIEPDESGSCELFKKLLLEVWCDGNEEYFAWVFEWFAHIIAYPGDKPGTSIAIRGQKGDGKSIVAEKMLAPILGDMLLRVTNSNLVLGNFNEGLVGKLLTVLEEAAFAGDKKAFATMKDLITGDTMTINPKHKPPYTVDSYNRLLIISNAQHFVDVEDGDRRLVVLNSSSAWLGQLYKFAAMMHEWNNGGASRFVYEALNHSFAKLPGTDRLVINTKIKTEYETVQQSASRGTLDRFLVELLLRGDFSAADVKPEGDFACEAGGADTNLCFWSLDSSKTVSAEKLVDEYHKHCAKFAPAHLRHCEGRDAIFDAAKEMYGEIGAENSRDPSGGRTRKRVLPSRMSALRHAYDKGQITKLEFENAGGTHAMPQASGAWVQYAHLTNEELIERLRATANEFDGFYDGVEDIEDVDGYSDNARVSLH